MIIALVQIVFAGSSGCCGKDKPYRKYCAATFDDSGALLSLSPIVASHLTLYKNYKWDVHYKYLSEKKQKKVLFELTRILSTKEKFYLE